MLAVKWNGLKKVIGTRTLFAHAEAGINRGEKVGLVGPNGVGKTTLLKMLTGEVLPDGGRIVWAKDLPREKIGLLTQHNRWEDGETVRLHVRRGRAELLQLHRERVELEEMLSRDLIAREMERVLIRYGEVLERIEAQGGYEWESAVERVLREVGLPEAVWDAELQAASGGQQTRAQLARLLLQEPDVLLLDEPTNHLDAETMEWLEGMIAGFAGTVVTVSHDRSFLDRTATRILELRPEGIGSYPGNYAAYAEAKRLERQSQQAAYAKQQAEMRQLRESIDRYKSWAAKAHHSGEVENAKKQVAKMHNKERQLERLQENRVPAYREAASLSVDFAGAEGMGSRVFSVEGAAVRYGERALYRDVTFAVERGQRIALLGPNGCGKSSLLKVITGELEPAEGRVMRSPQAHIGYFGQMVERLDGARTILEEVLDIEGMTAADARTVLAGFLFRGEDVFKRIETLSQGERCRVAFVKLYVSGANVLVLDEPTNYLDIPARERIEEALAAFPGTLLLVSHDRWMVERLATQLLVFADGKVVHVPDTYAAWRDRARRQAASPEERARAERKMILQMELAQLAEKHDDPLVRERMNEVQAALRELA